MRISGGRARGIGLRVTKSSKLRPATDANRERLFSSIGDFVGGKTFLDLFAGTGSYGLEALSRGASEGVFVEGNRRVFQDLRLNFEKTCKSAGLPDSCGRLENRDVPAFLRSGGKSFDLIFLDPPYEDFKNIGSTLFELLRSGNFVHDATLLIHESPPELSNEFPGWSVIRTLGKEKKGSPTYRLYRLSESSPQ